MARTTKRRRGPRTPRPGDDPARGQRIKDAMQVRGLSESNVSRALDVSVSTVARWKSGQQDPRGKVQALADLLGTTPHYIMFGAELSPALREFEAWLASTPAGDLAPPWILKSLRSMPLPKPTLPLYQQLFFVLLAETQR